MNNEFDEIILTLSRDVDSVFISLNDARAENERLRAELETAVSHLRAIIAWNDNGSRHKALVAASEWLRSRES